MGELRRIVCQKKYLLAVFVLLIANLFLFQYYQMDNLQALRDKETRQDTIDVWQEEQETAKEEFVSKNFCSGRCGRDGVCGVARMFPR